MDRSTFSFLAILILLQSAVKINAFHVEPIDNDIDDSNSVRFSDLISERKSQNDKVRVDSESIQFCNEARRGPPVETDSDQLCRRELRQHSPAEVGSFLDAALEDFKKFAAPCLREPISCKTSKLLDSMLVNADQPTPFPYWDWRLDADLDSDLNTVDLTAVYQFLKDALRFVELSRFMDEDLAAAVRNFTESKLVNKPDLRTLIRTTIAKIDGQSKGLEVGQVFRLLLATSTDEQLEEHDAKFDRVQCAAADRWLRWDELYGRCLARQPNLTKITITTVAPYETAFNKKDKNGSNHIYFTTASPFTVDVSDSELRPTVNESNNVTEIDVTHSIPNSITANKENLFNFSENETNKDTVDYMTNPLHYTNTNAVNVKNTLTQNITVNISDGVDTLAAVIGNIVNTEYNKDIDEFLMNLVLSAIQSPTQPDDTVKMIGKTNTVENIEATNLFSENAVSTTDKPTSTSITVIETKSANPIIFPSATKSTTPYYVPTVNNLKKYRNPNRKPYKKQRKHKKTKKLTTITTTTTAPTITVADDDNIWDSTFTVANSYWPRKKSGYYKFDKKYLSKYRSPTPTFDIEYRNSSETVALDNNWNTMADKISNSRYIFDTKYNFPEEKPIYSKLNGEKPFYDNNALIQSMNRNNSLNTVNVTFDSAVDYHTSTNYRIPTTINTVAFASPEVDPENHLDRLLKYLPKPKLPKGTIRWRAHTVPIPMAYFTITVIQGALSRQRRQPSTASKRRVTGAQIYVTGLNMPTGYIQITEGHQLKDSSGVILRTLNPRSSGPFVEFKVRVINRLGKSCRQLCLDSSQRYRRCARKALRLSTNRLLSDPIPFYQSAMDAIDRQWTGRGYYRRRKPDYLLYRCD